MNPAACRSAREKPHHCSDNVSDDFLTTFVCLVQVDLKPASDVLAGAMARAASQSTIHPLDTLKVLPTFGSFNHRSSDSNLDLALFLSAPRVHVDAINIDQGWWYWKP